MQRKTNKQKSEKEVLQCQYMFEISFDRFYVNVNARENETKRKSIAPFLFPLSL